MTAVAQEPALTRREREVLDLLLEDLRPEDIGEQLGLAGSTVRNHLSSLFRKTGTRSQAELLRLIRRRGATAAQAEARKISMTCLECGATQVAAGAGPATMLLERAEQAHDLLSPDCPVRWATRRVGL